MTQQYTDRAYETCTVAGLADAILTGVILGYQAIPAGDSVCVIEGFTNGSLNGEWEVVRGVRTGSTFTRDTIIDSSNTGAKVNFTDDTEIALVADSETFEDIIADISTNTGNITALQGDVLDKVDKTELALQTMVGELNLPDATLAAIDKIVNANAVVDVFIYDTTFDDDGGAWIDKANYQSWYTEILNTATRGSTKAFPKLALIVAEVGKVTIYDAGKSDCPMWMTTSPTELSSGADFWRLGRDASNLIMLNGKLYLGTKGASDWGMPILDFINDRLSRYSSNSSFSGFGDIILERNSNSQIGIGSGFAVLVNDTINDIAVTSDGDVNNIVYVATEGGLSRIAEDGTVSNWTDDGDTVNYVSSVAAFDGYVYFAVDASSQGKRILTQPVNVPLVESRYSSILYHHFVGDSAVPYSASKVNYSYGAINSINVKTTNNVLGTARALTKLYPNPDDWGQSMIANITADFNSGIMHGDIRGAWLASTDDTDLVNGETDPDRSYKNNELAVYGTIIKTPVAAGAELVGYSGFSNVNYLQQEYNPDLDFGTGDFYVIAWAQPDGVNSFQTILDKRKSDNTGNRILFDFNGTTNLRAVIGVTLISTGLNNYNTGALHFVVLTRSGTTVSIYVDGVLAGTGTSSDNVDNGIEQSLILGNNAAKTGPIGNFLSLVRMGAGSPTAAQISTIYEQEKQMFQPDRKCTLQGTSSDVKAVDYDPVNDLITACTGGSDDHITKFNDLVVVDDWAEEATSVSTKNNKIVTGV